MNTIALTPQELDTIVEQTVKRTLEAVGAIPRYITRKEMIGRIGRGAYERGISNGYLNIIKNGGKTSQIRCLRSEFERYEERILV